jgi:hypothetical protein
MTTVTMTLKPHVQDEHKTVIQKAELVLERVLKEPSFRLKVETAEYSGGTQFKERNGKILNKTKEEVADIILKGIERGSQADDDLDMTISPYPHRKGVVGSAILGKGPIKPAIWFLDRCAKKQDAISLARHLMHEWLHVAGFFHAKGGPGQDDLPYQVGDIVREIAKEKASEIEFRQELEGFLTEDDLAAYFLEEFEDEVEYSVDEW